MATTEEEIRDEIKKLNERLEAQGKPKVPERIDSSKVNTIEGVDLQDISSGKVVIDMPERKPAVTMSQDELNANIAGIADGSYTQKK
jgi:hypothetical protein